MIDFLTRQLVRLCQIATDALDARRSRDRGGSNTLELVLIALGVTAIASIALAAMREGVISRVSQLR